jgi:hypothetical protein
MVGKGKEVGQEMGGEHDGDAKHPAHSHISARI